MYNVAVVSLNNTVLCSSFLPQWIATINNISKRIYLSENPEVSILLCSGKACACIIFIFRLILS